MFSNKTTPEHVANRLFTVSTAASIKTMTYDSTWFSDNPGPTSMVDRFFAAFVWGTVDFCLTGMGLSKPDPNAVMQGLRTRQFEWLATATEGGDKPEVADLLWRAVYDDAECAMELFSAPKFGESLKLVGGPAGYIAIDWFSARAELPLRELLSPKATAGVVLTATEALVETRRLLSQMMK